MTKSKKHILIVSSSLNTGGLEKCLVNFCNHLNPGQYEIDLYLFNEGRSLQKELNDNINLLPEYPLYYTVYNYPIGKSLWSLLKAGKIQLFAYRLRRFIRARFKRNLNTVFDWKYMQKAMMPASKVYDIAIGFEEGTACYYVAHCVNSKIKMGWIHTDIKKINSNNKLDEAAFELLDYVCTVSQNSLKSLVEEYPDHANKMRCFCLPAMLDYRQIDRMASEPCELKKEQINIVSVGRLVELKGFHLCVEALYRLVNDGYDAMWYVAGEGGDRNLIEAEIARFHMQDRFVLLGNCSNPYRYINAADICVQPSSYEGFSIAVWEEKYLKKPVVATTIPSNFEILTNGKNGLLIERDTESIYKALKYLLDNPQERKYLAMNSANTFDKAMNVMSEIEELFLR